jgi:hypothetical protein
MIRKKLTHGSFLVRHDDGTVELTGEVYTAWPELVWAGELKTCTDCRTPTPWRTPRGRGTHPTCAGTVFDTATPTLEARACWTAAAGLDAVEILTDWHPPPPPPRVPRRTLGRADAGCDICGRGGAVYWRPDGVWRCTAHNPFRVTRGS